jgi:endonuclease III-like uncharacterized protein
MKHKALSLIFILLLIGCNSKPDEKNKAQSVVDKAIASSGKSKLYHAKLNFNFRNKAYESYGNCDSMVLNRITTTEGFIIKDVYKSGENLKRYVNDSLRTIADTTATKISESINSVHYFVQLPVRLNDEAVQKTYVGLDTINNTIYHNVKVNFKKEGGGTDFQDVYLYWFSKDDYKLDYLAYSFVVNGGGIRFREAFNERYIEGMRFIDYKNYKPKAEDLKLENVFEAFKMNQLELLSRIENKDIKVKIINDQC